MGRDDGWGKSVGAGSGCATSDRWELATLSLAPLTLPVMAAASDTMGGTRNSLILNRT